MKKKEMAAVVFVTSKPVDTFSRGKWDPGFKFLPVEYSAKFEDHYLPSKLQSHEYPGLIREHEDVPTIAVPTILAAYNWPKNSERYRRLDRFIDRLYSRISKLQEPGFHPKWKDVNLQATVPGLDRFPAAQQWLDRVSTAAQVDTTLIREQARRAAQGNAAEEERLFQEFLDWRKKQKRN